MSSHSGSQAGGKGADAAIGDRNKQLLDAVLLLAKGVVWAVPVAGAIFVTVAVVTGAFGTLARVAQGYRVAQDATIEAPVLLRHQKFGAFAQSAEYKSFASGQSDQPVTAGNRDVIGDVLLWRFHVKGYAAAHYLAYVQYDASRFTLQNVLCEFDSETTDDSYQVCGYFAPGSSRDSRTVTVWLDKKAVNGPGARKDQNQYGPVAVRVYELKAEK